MVGTIRGRCGAENRISKLTANRIQGTLLIRRVQVSYSLAHHQTEFYLVVYTDALRAQNGTLIRYHDGRRRLEEEEGLFRLHIVQLGDVITVAIGGAEVSVRVTV